MGRPRGSKNKSTIEKEQAKKEMIEKGKKNLTKVLTDTNKKLNREIADYETVNNALKQQLKRKEEEVATLEDKLRNSLQANNKLQKENMRLAKQIAPRIKRFK